MGFFGSSCSSSIAEYCRCGLCGGKFSKRSAEVHAINQKPEMVCPHCGYKGTVTNKPFKRVVRASFYHPA